MATIDKTAGLAAAAPWDGKDKHLLIKNRVTLATAELVDANVVQALKVKAGWVVKNTKVKIITAAGGTTLTAGVGDGDSATGYDAAIDLKGTAGTVYQTAIGTDANGAAGKHYSADDTIDLTLAVNAATGPVVLDVMAEVLDLN